MANGARAPNEPIGIYVHMPWCIAKCPYCDFNSHVLKPEASLERYVDALGRDISADAARACRRVVSSIFIGGGTPSLFTPQQIGAVLEEIHRCFTVASDAEVTMEANPGALGTDEFGDYLAAGVNRLSLGAQSFDGRALTALGRIHGVDDIEAAYVAARGAGFDNINLDLMFGLPGQAPEEAARDVERALQFGPDHISYYELTLEPNTVFFAQPPADLPGEEAMERIQQQGLEKLSRAGYVRYEVSAFAREGVVCRHNVNYWAFGDYLGVGAGAHGKWTDRHGATWRSRKIAHPAAYVKALDDEIATGEVWQLEPSDKVFEFALNRLRLLDGFTEQDFTARTGLEFQAVADTVKGAERDGLLNRTEGGEGWRPSALGLRFLNDLQARFLPENRPISAAQAALR